MSIEPVIAYCVKCKKKQEMVEPTATYTASGTPATSGTCPVCGTKMFKMGRTPEHDHIPPPDPATIKSQRQKSPKVQSKDGKTKPSKSKLVIVESPAKARTVGKFLGKNYTVKASVGHVRDLLRSQLSVDVEGAADSVDFRLVLISPSI